MSGTSGTIRTDSYMLTNEQEDGQPGGSFTLQRLRDLTVSKVNVNDVYDDPGNTSGLGAPAIIRGTVYGQKASGLTLGAGQSNTVRTANTTALQAAITYALENGYYFEMNTGSASGVQVIEVNSTINILPNYTGFCWRWNKATSLVQYGTNVPSVTFGSFDNSATDSLYNYDIDGLTTYYGASQSGNTSANLVQIGAAAFSVFRGFRLGQTNNSGPINPAYQGLATTSGTSNSGAFFSNVIDDINISGAQETLLNHQLLSSGNHWRRIYCQQGNPTSGPSSIAYHAVIISNPNYGEGENEVFDQFNIEWALLASQYGRGLYINNLRGFVMNGLHLEGIAIGAYGASVIGFSECDGVINGCMVESLGNLSGSGGSSTSYIFTFFGYGECMQMNSVVINWYDTGRVNTDITSVFQLSAASAYGSTCTMSGFALQDSAGGNASYIQTWDPSTPGSNLPQVLGEYRMDAKASRFDAATFVISATQTVYGQQKRALILVPATLSGAIIITLADLMTSGTTLPPDTNTQITIQRETGTYANTMTVKDGGGTTLTTNSSAGVTYYYYFNGTAWATFT